MKLNKKYLCVLYCFGPRCIKHSIKYLSFVNLKCVISNQSVLYLETSGELCTSAYGFFFNDFKLLQPKMLVNDNLRIIYLD